MKFSKVFTGVVKNLNVYWAWAGRGRDTNNHSHGSHGLTTVRPYWKQLWNELHFQLRLPFSLWNACTTRTCNASPESINADASRNASSNENPWKAKEEGGKLNKPYDETEHLSWTNPKCFSSSSEDEATLLSASVRISSCSSWMEPALEASSHCNK